ncbi:MAG: DUF6502 family protein [Ramlibacter sp.]
MAPIESRADLTLAAAVRVLAPLLPLLLREGVTFQRLVTALKQALLEEAPAVLLDSGVRVSDSSVSTLTGIHRKDVREWRSVGRPRPQAKSFGAVMTAFSRWSTDPDYCDASGRPRVLERNGGAGSFEALAASVSNDVRPRTVLQELLRLGVAELVADASEDAEDRVRLRVDAFVPSEGTPEMLQLLSDNVADHLAAAVHNVLGATPPMLEQSIYADNLRPQSVERMRALVRKTWQAAFPAIVRKATALREDDSGQQGADQRMRIGMYFYYEPDRKA